MVTEERPDYAAVLAALDVTDWARVLDGVGAAEIWLRAATPGDPRIDELVSRLVILANHSKWEIRRAVANAAALALHPSFEGALAKLATDDNTRVRQAAEHAALRRRDWQNASTLGKQLIATAGSHRSMFAWTRPSLPTSHEPASSRLLPMS